jgi:hypothetical protein
MTDVEKCMQKRFFPSVMTLVTEFAQPVHGAEQLIADRGMLHR